MRYRASVNAQWAIREIEHQASADPEIKEAYDRLLARAPLDSMISFKTKHVHAFTCLIIARAQASKRAHRVLNWDEFLRVTKAPFLRPLGCRSTEDDTLIDAQGRILFYKHYFLRDKPVFDPQDEEESIEQ